MFVRACSALGGRGRRAGTYAIGSTAHAGVGLAAPRSGRRGRTAHASAGARASRVSARICWPVPPCLRLPQSRTGVASVSSCSPSFSNKSHCLTHEVFADARRDMQIFAAAASQQAEPARWARQLQHQTTARAMDRSDTHGRTRVRACAQAHACAHTLTHAREKSAAYGAAQH